MTIAATATTVTIAAAMTETAMITAATTVVVKITAAVMCSGNNVRGHNSSNIAAVRMGMSSSDNGGIDQQQHWWR